jgi:hypothetical protein
VRFVPDYARLAKMARPIPASHVKRMRSSIINPDRFAEGLRVDSADAKRDIIKMERILVKHAELDVKSVPAVLYALSASHNTKRQAQPAHVEQVTLELIAQPVLQLLLAL